MKHVVTGLMILFMSNLIFGQEVPQAKLLSHWFNDELPASDAHDNTYNEVWGLFVNDREFAVIGSTMGTHFIDVTDTDNIEEVAFVEGSHTGPAIIHRDYHDNDGFLYAVADEGESTLQIIDIRDLPNSIEVVYESNSLIRRSHNIFIDEENDRLYSCAHTGISTGYSPMRVLDISDPMNPMDLGGFDAFESFDVGHVHDAYILNHIAYLNCGPDGFAIVDMTNLEAVKLLASLSPDDYPDSGYNHSGWLAEEGDVYYMADENHGLAVKAINVEDYTDLETKNLFDAGFDVPNAIPHNLIVDGDLLFVSYYYDGLQVYDISDRESPTRIMHYPTSQLDNNFQYRGAWGVYPLLPSGNVLVSDMQEGLFVISREASLTNNENLAAEKFGIFPNPAVDQLQLSIKTEGDYDYQIKDLAGKVVQEGRIREKLQSIHTSALPSGSYIIELSDGQQVYAQLFSTIK